MLITFITLSQILGYSIILWKQGFKPLIYRRRRYRRRRDRRRRYRRRRYRRRRDCLRRYRRRRDRRRRDRLRRYRRRRYRRRRDRRRRDRRRRDRLRRYRRRRDRLRRPRRDLGIVGNPLDLRIWLIFAFALAIKNLLSPLVPPREALNTPLMSFM